jgi:toxin CptA
MRRRLAFSPSRYLAAILAAAHGLALFALVAVLPAWAAVASGGVILASLAYYLLRDAWLRLNASCVGLAMDGDGVEMSLRDGTRVAGVILRDSVVTPALVVLNIRPQAVRAARSIVILPDSLDAESFRELRVWLKWGEHAEDAPE